MKKYILACLLLLAACAGASAAEVFGTVDEIVGSATIAGQDGAVNPVAVGLKIYEKDTVSTGHDAEVHIITEDGGFIALRPDSVFRVDEYKAEGGENDRTFVSLVSGALRSITGWIGAHNHAAYRVTTPTATIGIRGTDHEVTVINKEGGDEPGTYDTVNEGGTVMKTPQGEVEGAPGKFIFAPKGRPVAPAVLSRQPHFWAERRLRIENRVQQRKEYLRAHHEQMREERVREIQRNRPERLQERQNGAQTQQGARQRADERAQAMERRNEMRENRAQEIRRQRAEKREHAEKQQQEGNAKHREHKRIREHKRE